MEEKEEFNKLFNKKQDDEIIIWSDDNVGFTVIRKYPDNLSFIPAKNKNGVVDTVCMIKVGFADKEESNEKRLFGSVSKVSKYLLSNHWNYDFNDPEAPTKDSLEESKRSLQPIDLDITDFLYKKDKKKIIDKNKNNEEISLNELIEKIYKLHLKTIKITGSWFRLKVKVKNQATEPVEDIKKFLIMFLYNVFGKTLQSENKTSFEEGLFKPYSHKRLYSLADEQVDLFHTGIKISKKPAYLSAITIFIIMLISTYWIYLLWWKELKEQNQVVQISFAMVLILIIDYIIPHFILCVINLLIRFRIRMWKWKITIN